MAVAVSMIEYCGEIEIEEPEVVTHMSFDMNADNIEYAVKSIQTFGFVSVQSCQWRVRCEDI